MAAIDDLEGLLLARYNIDAPTDATVFAAVALVREDPSPDAIELLAKELKSRAMYHWHEPIYEALAALQSGAPEPKEGLEAMEYKALAALAKSRGIQSVGVKRADLIELLMEKPAEPTA